MDKVRYIDVSAQRRESRRKRVVIRNTLKIRQPMRSEIIKRAGDDQEYKDAMKGNKDKIEGST